MAQIVVVEHVLIAQCDAEDALADQRRHRVLDPLRRPAVGETASKAIDQLNRPVARPQQKGTGIRGDLTAIKRAHHRAPFDACKFVALRTTLRRHRDSP